MDIKQRLLELTPEELLVNDDILLETSLKIKHLQLALLDCNKIHNECVGEGGVPDAIDSDGELYQSEDLSKLLEEAAQSL